MRAKKKPAGDGGLLLRSVDSTRGSSPSMHARRRGGGSAPPTPCARLPRARGRFAERRRTGHGGKVSDEGPARQWKNVRRHPTSGDRSGGATRVFPFDVARVGARARQRDTWNYGLLVVREVKPHQLRAVVARDGQGRRSSVVHPGGGLMISSAAAIWSSSRRSSDGASHGRHWITPPQPGPPIRDPARAKLPRRSDGAAADAQARARRRQQRSTDRLRRSIRSWNRPDQATMRPVRIMHRARQRWR